LNKQGLRWVEGVLVERRERERSNNQTKQNAAHYTARIERPRSVLDVVAQVRLDKDTNDKREILRPNKI
jgi:hypothetical protein